MVSRDAMYQYFDQMPLGVTAAGFVLVHVDSNTESRLAVYWKHVISDKAGAEYWQ